MYIFPRERVQENEIAKFVEGLKLQGRGEKPSTTHYEDPFADKLWG